MHGDLRMVTYSWVVYNQGLDNLSFFFLNLIMCDSGEIPLEEGMSSILDLQPNEATFFFFFSFLPHSNYSN